MIKLVFKRWFQGKKFPVGFLGGKLKSECGKRITRVLAGMVLNSSFSRQTVMLAFAGALMSGAWGTSAAAGELVVNGNFTSNAASFTTFPGYAGSGGNPTNVSGWTQILGSAGGYGVNGSGTVTSVFGPASTGGNTFLFIQASSTKELAQNLPGLMTGTSYILSFGAAARNQTGESNDTFNVQVGDNTGAFISSGNVIASNTVFNIYRYSFTTPTNFNGTPSVQLYNLSTGGDHTVDFTAVSVQSSNSSQSLAVFLPATGNWNTPANWSGGVVPAVNQSPDIVNGSVATVDSNVGSCGSIFVGQSSQTPTGTVLFRPGGSLTAINLLLGRDGANYGQFNQSGGALTVNGYLSVGDGAGGGSGASGEYNLSGGTLSVGSTVMVGNQGIGRMLLAGNAVLSTPSLQVGVASGAQGSQLFQWGGTIYTGNLTVGASGVSNCAFTISSGVTLWSGNLLVNGTLTAQGSQFLLQCTNTSGVGLQVANSGTLQLQMDAQGFSPIQLGSTMFSIAPGSHLVVDGSRYTRWRAQPGTFPLIQHGGYAGQAQFAATNVTLSGFYDLTAALSYSSNTLNLVLSAPTNGTARMGQGIVCEYWQVPITVNPGVSGRVIAAPLSALPAFTNSLVAEHPIFAQVLTNFNLTPRLQDTNYFMRFSGYISVPTNGSYTFYLNSSDGSSLWLDGNLLVNNDGVHAPVEVSAVTNLTAGLHALVVGYFQTADAQVLNVSWTGPGFAKQAIPDAALFLSAQSNVSVRQPVYQNVVFDSEANYNYAPSFMYDETEGLYKIWMCGAGIPGCVGGDNILYREATSLQGLLTAPLTVALQPSLDPTKFDQIHACDPNVYRVGNTYYLAYGGACDGSQLPGGPNATRIGMAASYDGGRKFQRLNNGNAILSPNLATYNTNVYGIGQPAVVPAADGYYYMIYTDANGNGIPDYQRVIRSLDPAFTPGNFTNVANILASAIGGYSLDLAYDDSLNQFVVINGLERIYFTTNWTQAQKVTLNNPFNWSLGEGHGLLMNSLKRPVNYNQDGVVSYVLIASTIDATNDTTLWANWVAGDLKYLVFPQNAAPVIAPISATNLVAGVVLSLPKFGTDPNVPPLRLTYSLLSAPAGMTINSISGVISWRPTIAQSPSTNWITLKVTDNGVPILSSTQTFSVIVVQPVQPMFNGFSTTNGQFSLSVSGSVGPDYTLLASTNLIQWTPLLTTTPVVLPVWLTDPAPMTNNQYFYRIILKP